MSSGDPMRCTATAHTLNAGIREYGSRAGLVSALAVEQSEEWVTGRRYLDMEELREHRRSEERDKNGMMLMER